MRRGERDEAAALDRAGGAGIGGGEARRGGGGAIREGETAAGVGGAGARERAADPAPGAGGAQPRHRPPRPRREANQRHLAADHLLLLQEPVPRQGRELQA